MQQEPYQQVDPTRQTPSVLCDGEVFDLPCYHPYTKLEELPLGNPMKNAIRKYDSSYFYNLSTTHNVTASVVVRILLREQLGHMI